MKSTNAIPAAFLSWAEPAESIEPMRWEARHLVAVAVLSPRQAGRCESNRRDVFGELSVQRFVFADE